MQLNRWSPMTLGLESKIALRNRVVVPAMASATADVHGFVTAATTDHYRRLSAAGAGMINVEYTFVSRDGRSEENQLGASLDQHVPGLAMIAQIIKDGGAVAGLQLVHAGGKTSRDLTGGKLLGASAVAVPVKDRHLETPTAMTLSDIVAWQGAFRAAAARAVKAGFQAIEIHAAHGYGFNQWLSPITNLRTDGYGVSRAGRARILVETIAALRADFPALILGARIPGQDFVPGGLTVDDMAQIGQELVAAGLDYVSVSSGLGGWRRPRDRDHQGYLVEEATALQAALACPVVGVGGIETGEYIDDIVSKKLISLAAVGRAILANPSGWGRQNLGVKHGPENH